MSLSPPGHFLNFSKTLGSWPAVAMTKVAGDSARNAALQKTQDWLLKDVPRFTEICWCVLKFMCSLVYCIILSTILYTLDTSGYHQTMEFYSWISSFQAIDSTAKGLSLRRIVEVCTTTKKPPAAISGLSFLLCWCRCWQF